MTRHQARNVEHADYRAWLAMQPCAVCGAFNVQVAHVGVGGTGLKHGDDDQCIPLCSPGCHEDHDETKGRFARPTWMAKYTWRSAVQEWDAYTVAAHRGRFEARAVSTQTIPF